METLVSKHLIRRDLERDPDHINQMLWKRKIYKKRIERNHVKKARKTYFQAQDAPEKVTTDTIQVEDKKLEFYKQLFAKDGTEEEPKKKKKKSKKAKEEVKEEEKGETQVPEGEEKSSDHPKSGGAGGSFNKQLDRIREFREAKLKEREEREKAKLRQIKKKQKYAKKLNKKTDKGQPLMKNLISHYLSKIEKGQ